MASTNSESLKSSLLEQIRNVVDFSDDKEFALTQLHFPVKKQEEWKYSIPNFLADSYQLSSLQEVPVSSIPSGLPADACKMVFVNGVFSSELSDKSLPSGLEISFGPLNNSIKPFEENLFGKLNEASAEKQGIHLHVQKNASIEKSILLVHIIPSTGHSNWIQPSISIHLEANSSASFGEIWEGLPADHFVANAVNEIRLESGANLHWLHIQDGTSDGIIINQTRVACAANSLFRHIVLSAGSGFVRNNLDIHIEGSGAHADMFGLSLGNGSFHCDHHSFLHHAVPNTTSNQLYKGIYSGKSTGVFNGKILVDQIAQKTNAYQSGRNILLSPDAKVYAKPQLEIFADDVKCSHGATIGQLDEEPLFYLRSRGLDLATARLLLVRAFASEILMQINSDSLRTYAEEKAIRQLDEMTKS